MPKEKKELLILSKKNNNVCIIKVLGYTKISMEVQVGNWIIRAKKIMKDKINSVDLKLLEMLSSRRSLSEKVAQLKIKSNLEIRDIKQEHALLKL